MELISSGTVFKCVPGSFCEQSNENPGTIERKIPPQCEVEFEASLIVLRKSMLQICYLTSFILHSTQNVPCVYSATSGKYLKNTSS